MRDKYFVFYCDGRTCVILPVFSSNQKFFNHIINKIWFYQP